MTMFKRLRSLATSPRYKKKDPEFFLWDSEGVFYFWKGRIALYALLKALGVGPGDEIVIPGFTCVVVANAVLYLGAKPVYADVDADTYVLTAETVAPLINDGTKVVIAQNTFGLSPDLDAIMKVAESCGVYLIEDCAQGLGGSYKGIPNGFVAPASFYSTQWSKPISTGLGGIAFTRDKTLIPELIRIGQEMPYPGFLRELSLFGQLMAYPLIHNPRLHYMLVRAYRYLTQQVGISVGSSSGAELKSTKMPEGYGIRMGRIQYWNLKRNLHRLSDLTKARLKSAAFYDDFLSGIGVRVPFRPAYAEHGMLRYAIRVPDKKGFLARARKLRIPVGDWFVSPLHPLEANLGRWGYQRGMCPVAERASKEVINLPTDRPLSIPQLKQLCVDL